MDLGPDRWIYMIEFGTAWKKNPGSQLVRVEYIGAE